jgi:membrane-associated phospholipid phosphatase
MSAPGDSRRAIAGFGPEYWRQVRRNLKIVVPWTSFLYIGYQLTNHYQVFPVYTLPASALDRALPFLVWTVIPYFLLIAGMYLPIFLRSDAMLRESMTALTVAVLINYSIFFFFPTVVERPPLPAGDSLADRLYRWLIGVDSPANCFPSGHITAPAIGCWLLARQRLRWWPGIVVIYAVLAVSVLTTKQHYVIDIAGGLVTAAIGTATASRLRARGVWLAGAD